MHIARVNSMREDKCCWVGTHALSGSRFGSRISFCGTGVRFIRRHCVCVVTLCLEACCVVEGLLFDDKQCNDPSKMCDCAPMRTHRRVEH